MQRKYLEKKRLRKEIRSVSIQLKSCLTILVYSALLQRINMVVQSEKAIHLCQQKKLSNLQKGQYNYNDTSNIQKNIMHNFSTCTSTKNEEGELMHR